MKRVVLVDWSPAASQHAELMGRAYDVEALAPRGGRDLRALGGSPPQALVIDLTRLPSQGCAVAIFCRRQKSTRAVPIVFAGGEPEKVARVRGVLGDAIYTEWRGIRGALRRATAAPARDPLVPGTMAPYSGTPLPTKLGLRPGLLVALLGAPPGFEAKLGVLPPGTRLQRHPRGAPRIILLFAKSERDLRRRFPAAARALAKGGAVWIAWPKQASGRESDLDQRRVRAFGLRSGFVDYKICSIDETWAALRFARRAARKEAPP